MSQAGAQGRGRRRHGRICFPGGLEISASGHMDVCVAYGFETMSHVETWKGNEFIALASDVSLITRSEASTAATTP